MKFQSLSYGIGIAAALASVVDARANYYHKFAPSRTVVTGAYVVEFESQGSSPVFFDHLHGKGHTTTIRQQFQSSFLNGVSFQIHNDHDVNTILDAPGVLNVWPVLTIPGPRILKDHKSPGPNVSVAPKYETAHNLTGVTQVHDDLKIYGKGVKVGVIDTGLYYLHPAFGVNGKPGCYKKPGCRVQYGYDLVGDNYSASNPVAVPDDDPMDNCSEESHGTHVMGIVGANAAHLTGAYKPLIPFTGVAPEATLGAYRVFGCAADSTGNDVITQAILLAAKDGMDVINLSLGGGSAWHEELQDIVATRVGTQGHIVLGAQGNDGGTGAWVGGNPGLSQGGFGVASIDNVAAFSYAIDGPNGKQFGYSIATQYNKPFANLQTKIVINNPNANPQTTADDGCNPLTVDVTGLVVIFQQGAACSSKVRCGNAYAAKAVGCLIYNNAPGGESIYGDEHIPGGGMSMSDGQALVAIIKANPNTVFNLTSTQVLFHSDTAGTPSSFTSFAMDPELYIKPNIAGVGGNVYSTLSPHASNNIGYGTYSGTSMATPYMSGSLALYISAKGKPSFDILKAHFQNGAHPTKSYKNEWYASVAQQGAGLVNVLDTIQSQTLVTPSELALNDTLNTKKSYTISIKNSYSKEVTYEVSHEPAATIYNKATNSDMLLDNPIEAADYATVKFSTTSFKLAAGHSKSVQVFFTAPKASDANRIPVFSGYIDVTPQVANAPISRVTYAGLKGSWKSAPIFSEVDPLGGATNGIYNASGNPITSSNNHVNLTASPLLAITVLSTPSRIVYADVVSAKKDTKSLGYLFSTNNGPLYMTLAGRNAETAGQSTTQYTAFNWAGVVTSSYTGSGNSTLPAGEYKVRFFGLKHFGNAKKASDWEVQVSPAIYITY